VEYINYSQTHECAWKLGLWPSNSKLTNSVLKYSSVGCRFDPERWSGQRHCKALLANTAGNICFEFLLLVSLQCVFWEGKFFIFLRLGKREEVRGVTHPTPYPTPVDRAAT
jgi:hypothetical protein